MNFPKAYPPRSSQSTYNIYEKSLRNESISCDKTSSKTALEYAVTKTKAVKDLVVSIKSQFGNVLRSNPNECNTKMKDVSLLELIEFVTKDPELWIEFRNILTDNRVVTHMGVREILNQYMHAREMHIKIRYRRAAADEAARKKALNDEVETKCCNFKMFQSHRGSTGSLSIRRSWSRASQTDCTQSEPKNGVRRFSVKLSSMTKLKMANSNKPRRHSDMLYNKDPAEVVSSIQSNTKWEPMTPVNPQDKTYHGNAAKMNALKNIIWEPLATGNSQDKTYLGNAA